MTVALGQHRPQNSAAFVIVANERRPIFRPSFFDHDVALVLCEFAPLRPNGRQAGIRFDGHLLAADCVSFSQQVNKLGLALKFAIYDVVYNSGHVKGLSTVRPADVWSVGDGRTDRNASELS